MSSPAIETPPPLSADAAAEWAAALEAAEREVAELEAAERAGGGPTPVAACPPPVAPVVPAGPGRLRKVFRLGLALVFGIGVGAGVRAGLLAFGLTAPRPAAPHIPRDTLPFDLATVDALIRSGSYRDALTALKSAPEGGSDARAVAYREGLCLEALDRAAEADAAYLRAADPGDAASWARATLGRVRCALAAGNLPAARELLAGVTARAGDPECRGRRIVEEWLHLRARLAVLDLGPPRPMAVGDVAAAAWPPLGGGLAEYLDWLPVGKPNRPAADVGVLVAAPTAADALRAALAAAPDHPTAFAAQLALANLEFTAGRCAEAGREYRRLLETHARKPEAVYAAYNLALVRYREGNTAAARELFLEVVDRGAGTPWSDLGRSWVRHTRGK